MTRIGVVGAGAAGAAATFAITDRMPAADVTVLEKSGGVCGRAATRRHGELTYDYGANYVKSADSRVTELLTERLDSDGLVDVTEPVYTFDADGTVSPGRDVDEHKWSYERGLTQTAKRLFAASEPGVSVHRRTRVTGLVRDGGGWTIVDADGREWGPFDAVAMNPPAPQTAALLRETEWDSPTREAIVEAAAAVAYRTIWTGVFHYRFELDRRYYALVNDDKAHAVGWIAREECKPGHVPDGESLLIVQAAPGWSRDHYERDPTENLAELADLTADVVGDERLRDPDWTDHQGWRYALPEGGIDSDVVASAADAGIYLLGDWVAGDARLHAALRNGLETGERIADEYS